MKGLQDIVLNVSALASSKTRIEFGEDPRTVPN